MPRVRRRERRSGFLLRQFLQLRRFRRRPWSALLLTVSCLSRDPAERELGEENAASTAGAGDEQTSDLALVLPADYPDPPERFTAALVAPGTPHPPDPFAAPAAHAEVTP